ncbi:polysaccharide pyruvyl transferase family protein [Psychroflexus planctonicus]|uniref:Polysaccharide pyruvyl transferase domain-containing protein n=1 Tax=Psychroflexus planctonicus TaxID=1526575 RepID=A0ABQ1SIY3_9FLAO|nr:polysaccharide pyruvyl transferase family protein [Psychroflexus planctonicus]GGE41912.1 hypothetical protein GCM10010832_22460 [Psychroflexus planctonicus]
MKILTVTCHGVYNHGAILQEYALLKYLKQLGHEAQAINYQPKYLVDSYRFFGVPSPKWQSNFIKRAVYVAAKLPKHLSNLKRYKAFDKFSSNYIDETKVIYQSNEDLIRNLPLADAYICGSDQIWNTLFQNGKDPAFYLDFVPEDKIKFSYAASFATDHLHDGYEDFVYQKAKKLDHISVRESSGVKILEDICIKNSTRVMDPVFLLNKQFWIDEFVKPIPEDFILIYDFDTNTDLKNAALRLAREKGWKIFGLNKNLTYADEIFWSCDPAMFLTLLYHSKFVLCNSFHALAFSLIFEKQFVVFNRNVGINTRMKDLLNSLNLDTRMGTTTMEGEIDYKDVNIKINELIKTSKDFIEKALN